MNTGTHLNLDELDRALDRCLEAAIDPTLWPEVMDRVVAATGSFGANLIPTSNITPGAVVITDSMKAGFEQYWADGWNVADWRLQGVPLLKRKGTARDQEYTSREQFENSSFYKFQAKYGIGRSCIIGFNSAPDEILTLTLHRTLDRDFYSDEEASSLQKVGMRLAASAEMAKAISGVKVSGMREALDMSGVAAVFFDRFFRVTAVTAAMEKLLGHGIDIGNGILMCHDPRATSAIQNKMRQVIGAKWLHSTEPSGPLLISRTDRRPLRVLVQRLGGNLPDIFAHSVGVCLITDPDQGRQSDAQHLSKVFGFTRSEAATAAMIAQGLSLREIAEQRHISYETVRSHLRSIFGKTDTKRQAELVKLLATLGH